MIKHEGLVPAECKAIRVNNTYLRPFAPPIPQSRAVQQCNFKMASDEDTYQGELPPFRKEITDLKLVNISIKCYEKKTGTGFKEEYYAFKMLSM